MDAHRIDSPKNPRVKALVRLRERRERDATGLAPVEGARELRRALTAGLRVQEAFVCPPLLRGEGTELPAVLARAGVPVTELSRAAFERCSIRQGPDGVIGVVRIPPAGPPQRLPADPLVLGLVGLEKPGNVGGLIRTADAAGVDATVLCGDGTDPWNPGVIRASMGSVFARPPATIDDEVARSWAKDAGLRIVATTPGADTLLWDADLRGGCMIVLGPEHEGLDDAWLETADVRVRVPMGGLADSLNVGVTGALLIYEARRQRRSRESPGSRGSRGAP